MLTFGFLYILHYIFTFFFFFIFFNYLFNTTVTLKLPFTTLVNFIKQYTSFNFFFFIIILNLAGFPPFFLFYPKFILLVEITTKCAVHIQLLLLLFFFIMTNFYLQFFDLTSNIYPLNLQLIRILQKTNKSSSNNFSLYNITYLFFYFTFFNLFSYFFITDFFAIIYNIL